ncbi:MAG: sulfate ABC transporter permease subunit CysW [Rickettsiales bacterium]
MVKDSRLIRSIFILSTIMLVTIFFALPVLTMLINAFSKGIIHYFDILKDEEALEAIKLSLLIVVIAIPINLVFGIAASWCIAKFQFRGKDILMSLIDLPLSISPIISGFMFLSIFGIDSLIGSWLDKYDMQFIFAIPAIIITTLFVTLPFMARELIPIMVEYGNDEEEAAISLGASGLKTFIYVTLPNIKWGVLYGLLLSLSRAFGEFGAVSVVSGHIRGETITIPMHVEILYNEYNYVAAFALASVLAFLSMIALIIKNSFYRNN